MACKIVRLGGKKRKVCWRGPRGRLGKIKSNKAYSGSASAGAWVSDGGTSGVGRTKGRKRRVLRRMKRKPGRGNTTSRRPVARTRSISGASTFKAKKSYAITGLGKLRKGCRKIKKNGRTEYRCSMPGKKVRKARKRRRR